MAYPLTTFVASTLAQQTDPPRSVSLTSIARAVLAGADCMIYAGSGVVFLGLGAALMITHTGASGIQVRPSAVGAVLPLVGILCLALAVFRIWRVAFALRQGDAHMAEISSAEVSSARLYGTPWGEPMMVMGRPIAARGEYRVTDTGETGRYYMQQNWALSLRPGDKLWVVRKGGRDVLYAPGTVRTSSVPAAP
jgi:hypothetical protein